MKTTVIEGSSKSGLQIPGSVGGRNQIQGTVLPFKRSPTPERCCDISVGAQSQSIAEPSLVKFSAIMEEADTLNRISTYHSKFDYSVYENLEKRFGKDVPRGGFIFKGPMKLVNHHYSCQECLYSFMIDTYGRGCIHDCLYCYAKSELIVHGSWNRPFPMPIDINSMRKVFYTVFETSKKSRWRSVMEKKIPLRIGYASDSFMWIDRKYGVTKELLRMLRYYKYPYIIATRSDLIAEDEYVELLDSDLAALQMSIISCNDSVNKKLEPGAPSSERRLRALEKLNSLGFWTTVRINPLFPIHPDGYFSRNDRSKEHLKLDIFSWDMISQIAQAGVPAIIGGFGRYSPYAINQMNVALGIDLKEFFDGKKFSGTRDYHFSDTEIRYYYERIRNMCRESGTQFSTCYIGNGETFFWKDQDLWDNKTDCCNAKGRVGAFVRDAQEVPFKERLKFCTNSCGKRLEPERGKIEILDHLPKSEWDNNPFLR